MQGEENQENPQRFKWVERAKWHPLSFLVLALIFIAAPSTAAWALEKLVYILGIGVFIVGLVLLQRELMRQKDTVVSSEEDEFKPLTKNNLLDAADSARKKTNQA